MVGKRGSGQIEHEHLGLVALGELERRFAVEAERIAGLESLAVDFDPSAHDLHPGLARRVETRAQTARRRRTGRREIDASAWIVSEPSRPSGEATRRSVPRLLAASKCFCS